MRCSANWVGRPSMRRLNNPTFVEGRAASFRSTENWSAYLGEVHPEVLTNFGLTFPVALAEFTLQRMF